MAVNRDFSITPVTSINADASATASFVDTDMTAPGPLIMAKMPAFIAAERSGHALVIAATAGLPRW